MPHGRKGSALRRTLALVWLIVKRQHMVLSGAALVMLFCAFPGHAQEKEVATPALQGQGLFIENCSTCHKYASDAPKAPSQQTLMHMTPEAVLAALTTGPMAVQVQSLTDQQKRLIAIYLGGRPLGSAEAGEAKTMPNRCAANPDLGDPLAGAAWNGWGVDIANTRFQPAKAAGLSASDVPSSSTAPHIDSAADLPKTTTATTVKTWRIARPRTTRGP